MAAEVLVLVVPLLDPAAARRRGQQRGLRPGGPGPHPSFSGRDLLFRERSLFCAASAVPGDDDVEVALGALERGDGLVDVEAAQPLAVDVDDLVADAQPAVPGRRKEGVLTHR